LIHVPLHIKEQPVHSQMSVGQINLFPVFFHIQMNWNGMKYVLVALKSSSDSNLIYKLVAPVFTVVFRNSCANDIHNVIISDKTKSIFCVLPSTYFAVLQTSDRGQYASHQQLRLSSFKVIFCFFRINFIKFMVLFKDLVVRITYYLVFFAQ
jgi:hypothetical protein